MEGRTYEKGGYGAGERDVNEERDEARRDGTASKGVAQSRGNDYGEGCIWTSVGEYARVRAIGAA